MGSLMSSVGMSYLSEQYKIELLGVIICFSQTVLSMELAWVVGGAIFRRVLTKSSRSSRPSILRRPRTLAPLPFDGRF
jgi:hypothetical protein